jgi:hypothetical protein
MGEDGRATGKNYATKAEIPLHLARLRVVLDVPVLIPATMIAHHALPGSRGRLPRSLIG